MIDVLGWLGSGLLVLSLLQRRMLTLRLINLAACVALVVYNWLVGVWPMVGMNAAVAVIDIFYLFRFSAERREQGGSSQQPPFLFTCTS